MRWTPIVVDVVIVVVVWTAALRLVQQGRRRLAGAPHSERHGYRFQTAGVVCATTGLTFFVLWLLTDATGPRWLHALAQPAALVTIALAAVLSGYSAWIRSR